MISMASSKSKANDQKAQLKKALASIDQSKVKFVMEEGLIKFIQLKLEKSKLNFSSSLSKSWDLEPRINVSANHHDFPTLVPNEWVNKGMVRYKDSKGFGKQYFSPPNVAIRL